jgi:subtilisin family serine protease
MKTRIRQKASSMATANKHPQLTTAVASLWRSLRRNFFKTYRPELHYMRGPGPKWREKHQSPSQAPRARDPCELRYLIQLYLASSTGHTAAGVCVAVLDGPVDDSHPGFQGAK